MLRFLVVLHRYDDFKADAPVSLVAGGSTIGQRSYLIEEAVYLGRDRSG